jgi:hypothetical protein
MGKSIMKNTWEHLHPPDSNSFIDLLQPSQSPEQSLSEDQGKLIQRIAESAAHGDKHALDEWMTSIRSMSEKERSIVLKVLSGIKDTGDYSLLDTIWQIDFERKPVSVDEFLDNPYYLGDIGQSIYPKWREELNYVCDHRSKIVEWLISGSLRQGKTWIGLMAILYRGVYICSCLRDPQKYFGMASKSPIVFGLFNRVLDSASLVDFQQMSSFIDAGKYFKEQCPRSKKRTEIEFPSKNLFFKVGSSDLHALGNALFSYIVDEINFMQGEADVEGQAHKLYNQASRRLKMQFGEYGVNPGLAVIVSSKKAQTSFLEIHMRESKDDPSVHISDYAIWEVRGRDRYLPESFRVIIGNEYSGSKIVDDVDIRTLKVTNRGVLEQGQRYIEVPVDFYADFRRDIDSSLRDIGGVGTLGVTPLIKRPESVYECIDDTLVHPFRSESIHVPTSNPDPKLMLKLVDWSIITKVDMGSRRPKLHPEAPRFIHTDIGLTKCNAGVVMVHPHGFFSTSERDPITQQVTEAYRPEIWVDFMIEIQPTQGNQIDITKIITFILNLRNYGYNLMRATFDGYQSATAIQAIQHAGQLPEYQFYYRNQQYNLESQVVSMDRTDVPYTMLRDQMEYNGIRYYRYEPYLREIIRLEHYLDRAKKKDGTLLSWYSNGKVDHSKGESKDTSDACAGACYSLLTSKIAVQMDPGDLMVREPRGRKSIKSVMDTAIVSDYKGIERVVEIVPTPEEDIRNTHPDIVGGGNVIEMLAKLMGGR